MSKKNIKKNNKKKHLPFPTVNTTVTNNDKKSILKIVTPIINGIEPTAEYMTSINALIEAEEELPFQISYDGPIVCNLPSIGRNAGINGGNNISTQQKEYIQKMEYNGILFINSDIEFNVDNVRKLLAHNVPIIGAKYHNKHDLDYIAAGYWSQQIGYSPKYNWLTTKATGLHKVDWCGVGFLYVAKYILENVSYPWFFNTVISVKAPTGTSISVQTSDEVGFAMKVFQIGANIYCDCDNEVNCKVTEPIPSPKELKK